MLPTISIILPVYNGVKYVKKAVSSVLSQEYKEFEFLVLDDCSSDGSWEYLQSLQDERITLFRNEKNKGLFYNLNYLIGKSSGEIIKIWSQDDVMNINCIGEVVAFHNKHPQISFSYTGAEYIDATDKKLDINREDSTPEIVTTELHAKIAFITGSIAGNIANVAINKSVLNEVGLFNESMKISGDFEMWIRLAQRHPVGFIKQRLIKLRNHKEQLSGQEKYFIYHLKEDIEAYKILFAYIPEEQLINGRELLRNNKLLFYYTLMLKALLKGKINTAFNFFKLLCGFDNFFALTWCFIKAKVFNK